MFCFWIGLGGKKWRRNIPLLSGLGWSDFKGKILIQSFHPSFSFVNSSGTVYPWSLNSNLARLFDLHGLKDNNCFRVASIPANFLSMVNLICRACLTFRFVEYRCLLVSLIGHPLWKSRHNIPLTHVLKTMFFCL